MALVDYSSSESDADGEEAGPSPPATAPSSSTKRRKSSGGVPVPVLPTASRAHEEAGCDRYAKTGEAVTTEVPRKKPPTGSGHDQQKSQSAAKSTSRELPPLPDEFYDLYASNVRTAVVDDPNLHQGRKRLIPHVAGNWPSHIYLEWHPSKEQHSSLVALVDAVQAQFGSQARLSSFLTSDFGAPLPLHVSLSRPIVLGTADKDAFLERLTQAVGTSLVHQFGVSPRRLAWYASPDSNRNFLVLHVCVTGESRQPRPPSPAPDEVRADGSNSSSSSSGHTRNSHLVRLLTRCNDVVASFDQPVLYARAGGANSELGSVDDQAFHVSIAWTFDIPDKEGCRRALELLQANEHNAIKGWEVEVTGVKAKIGNHVSHLALPVKGVEKAPRNLFSW